MSSQAAIEPVGSFRPVEQFNERNEMSKNDQKAQERLAKHEPKVPAPDRGGGVLETKQVDRAIKDALEDDEVRETLRLHHRDKRP